MMCSLLLGFHLRWNYNGIRTHLVSICLYWFSQHINLLFARLEGFEPPSTVLETGMLPLHHKRKLGKEKMVQWTSLFTIGFTLTVQTPMQPRTTDTLTLHHSPINLCWQGGIRTPVLRREQIYSLPPLTTRPPTNICWLKGIEPNPGINFFNELLTIAYFIFLCHHYTIANRWFRTHQP